MAVPKCCADITIIIAVDFIKTHCSFACSDALYDLLWLEELAVLSGSVMKEEIHKGCCKQAVFAQGILSAYK